MGKKTHKRNVRRQRHWKAELDVTAKPQTHFPRLKKPPPTELEVTATVIGRLINDIQNSRRRIGFVEQDLLNERSTLANLMLEHQAAVAKSKDLSLIPQPL